MIFLISKHCDPRHRWFKHSAYISYVDLREFVSSPIRGLQNKKRYVRIVEYRLSMYTGFMPSQMLGSVDTRKVSRNERKCTESSYV